MVDDRRAELIEAALQVRERAYAPYSKYRVGAALLSETRRIYAGCNVENASYGLSICAERVAACNAVAAGETQFVVLALAISGRRTPCGACRQFLAEFNGDLPLIIIDADAPDQVDETDLRQLLPSRFNIGT